MIFKASKEKSEAKQPASHTVFKNSGEQLNSPKNNFIYTSVRMKWYDSTEKKKFFKLFLKG